MKTSFLGRKASIWHLATCVIMVASNSFAQLITMTHSGVGSGTIGGTPFVNAAFTITDVANTSSRGSFVGGFFIDDSSASIAISGLGSFQFTTGTRTFVNNAASLVGFSRASASGTDLFNGPTNPAFSSWDMLSSTGPITGSGQLLQWSSVPVTTDGGVLLFNNANNITVTFQATVTAVPEPSSAVLFLGGAVCCLSRCRVKGIN